MFSIVDVILPTSAPEASAMVVRPSASDPMIIARVRWYFEDIISIEPFNDAQGLDLILIQVAFIYMSRIAQETSKRLSY